MKFLVIGPTYPFRGGIAYHTALLVRQLAEEHEVLFISFRAQYPRWLFPGKTDRDPSQEPLKVPCEYLLDPLNPVTWLSVAQRAIDFCPDVVFFPWWVPFWAICWWWLSRRFHRDTRAKIVFYCHNVQPHEAMIGIRWLSRKAFIQADAFVVQSEPDRILLEGILDPLFRPIEVFSPPSLKVVSEKSIDFSGARRELGLAEDEPVVLFFGFVRPYKGLDILIQAFSRLLKTTRAAY